MELLNEKFLKIAFKNAKPVPLEKKPVMEMEQSVSMVGKFSMDLLEIPISGI